MAGRRANGRPNAAPTGFARDYTLTAERILQAAEETGNCLAFWMKDRLTGLCLTRSDGYIDNLAVHPDFQNRGFGRAILAQAVSGLLASGAVRIHLDVAAVNVRAQRFYENCGWVECGCFADHTYFPVK